MANFLALLRDCQLVKKVLFRGAIAVFKKAVQEHELAERLRCASNLRH
jgi:hypothetical protein